MVTYNNKELNFNKPKSGGKNKSDVDGFYSTSDGEHFFIKRPADKGELFTELFAGLLLQEFKNRKLIDPIYFPSLICADVIRFDDGSYGLIQPLVSFDELHKVIGTSYRDGSDRDPKTEALFGPSYYTGVTKMGDSFGLSVALMFSLLLGAHSVHSGNMVVLKTKEQSRSRQYARIDWGDAFRYFAHELNNTNILYAYENRGWLNVKSLTKDYFLNYKNINGLFPAMAEKAQKILPHLNEALLADIVSSALKKIPADLIDKKTQDKLAGYMFMPSFQEITLGPEGSCDSFATKMGELLQRRMTSISSLQDLKPKAIQGDLYASVVYVEPQVLSFYESTPFPELLKQWGDVLGEKTAIKTDALNLRQLATCFNQYVADLAKQTESAHLWEQNPANNSNIFMPYHTGDGTQIHGHAFVAHYKESTIINRFFTLDPQTLVPVRFAGFEQSINDYTKAHQESDWAKLQTLLHAGQQVIATLDALNLAREWGVDDAVLEQIEALKIQLKAFNDAEEVVQHRLSTPHYFPPMKKNREHSVFYPISDLELNKMTGDQLATICLEEANTSPLVKRIASSDELWCRMDAAFNSDAYNSRRDGTKEKIATIRERKEFIEVLKEQATKEISVLEQKIIRLNGQVIAKTGEAAQLNKALEQQNDSIKSLQEQIQELRVHVAQAQETKAQLDKIRPQMELLQQQLGEVQQQKQAHQEELSAQEQLLTLLQEQLRALEMANASLIRGSDSSSHQLKELLEDVTSKQALLEQAEKELQRLSAIKEQQEIELGQVKQETKHSIQALNQELHTQNAQFEELQRQLDTKDHTILALRQQLKDVATPTQPSDGTEAPVSEELNKAMDAKLVQEQLKKEITSLQNEQKKDKSEIDRLKLLAKSAEEAEKNYDNDLKDRKDIYFARMERMLPIMRQILGIENKAEELNDRNETTASQEAFKLANRLRADIKEYAENPKKNENVALNDFKIKATETISKSKGVLGEHRGEWKYILANITLGILLVGVGYAAAILINKQVTGNYTFFSKTESIKQVEELEENIVSKTIQSLNGG